MVVSTLPTRSSSETNPAKVAPDVQLIILALDSTASYDLPLHKTLTVLRYLCCRFGATSTIDQVKVVVCQEPEALVSLSPNEAYWSCLLERPMSYRLHDLSAFIEQAIGDFGPNYSLEHFIQALVAQDLYAQYTARKNARKQVSSAAKEMHKKVSFSVLSLLEPLTSAALALFRS